jgi:membrane protein implicated in regulation of membrane protease activity
MSLKNIIALIPGATAYAVSFHVLELSIGVSTVLAIAATVVSVMLGARYVN